MLNNENKDQSSKKPVISFYAKEKMLCPVCKKSFAREEMLSGGGRMIAGDLTDELHRQYEPSAKYGKIEARRGECGHTPPYNISRLTYDNVNRRFSASAVAQKYISLFNDLLAKR